jgi:hypothetical protein
VSLPDNRGGETPGTLDAYREGACNAVRTTAMRGRVVGPKAGERSPTWGKRVESPLDEPRNSYPPGLATTTRMAARPSSYLQREPAAPFRRLTLVSITPSWRVPGASSARAEPRKEELASLLAAVLDVAGINT